MAATIAAHSAKRNRAGTPSVFGMIGSFVEWQRSRAAAAKLKAMPDHLLDDLGLSRADIDHATFYGRR